MEERGQTDNMNAQLEALTFDAITVATTHTINTTRDEAFANIKVRLDNRPGTHNFNIKVDTGAGANTLPFRTFKQMFPKHLDDDGNPCKDYLQPTKQVLFAYNNTPIECRGTTNIKCCYKDSIWISAPFYVVDVPGPAILGLPSCEQLNVVTLHCAVTSTKAETINSVNDLVQKYPNQFDSIGEFPTTHKLIVDPNIPCHIDPPRRVPIALKDTIKLELDKMVDQKVIRPITEPTEWVSSLTYVTKQDGSLRVCLDPRRLNQALLRPYHQIPTVEDLNHRFTGMKVFSKLDAKAGYWSAKLDPESKKLTTFQTPFGRYCFQRLPFGLSVSQDIFQLEIDRILEKCKGACGIADDIVICGADEEEHDRNLVQFMEVISKHGLTLNSKKCHIKCSEISFFGNVYTNEGMKPDPKKVDDLKQMQEPSNKSELQQFLGCMTYLSRFIPNFSDKTTVLRELLKKESDFIWEAHHQRTFESLKNEISKTSLLVYYDPHKPVHLHCDASLKGIGAALLQPATDNTLQPVAFASKSLTPTEQRYACIERELLAIVFGAQRFHTYLYGRSFVVHTDHRPLVMITSKPITAAPPRLQRMLIALSGYNMSVIYQPGVNNQLADGLSRFPNPQNTSKLELDMRVDFIRFSPNKIDQLRTDTMSDPALQHLQEIIITGWPERMNELPTDLRSYWSVRDELSIENGLILKGQQIVIPRTQQQDLLKQLHTAHLGKEKTQLLAKETVYWCHMNKDIERTVESCTVCLEHQRSQQPEPLMQHEIPQRPWSVVGTDLFEHNGKPFLLIADYYSKYPVVKPLPNPAPSSQIVSIMKDVFAEFGIPDKVMSDNGPHYSSQAFRTFAQSWGFVHTTSSPRRPQGNGFIERQVQTIKQLLKKSIRSGSDFELALLHWRATPINSKIPSPAQLLLGRRVKSTIISKVENSLSDKEEIRNQLIQRQQAQKMYFDRHALKQDLPPLYRGQHVRLQHPTSGSWEPATIQSTTDDPRSYIVHQANGQVVRRNRQHIRETPIATPTVMPAVTPVLTPDTASAVTSTALQNPVSNSGATLIPEAERENIPKPATPIRGPENATRHSTRSGRISKPPQRFADL